MAFFLLHEVLPVFRSKPGSLEPDSGKRNCVTFLLGVAIYVAIYVVLKNTLGMTGAVDAFVCALMWIAFADAGTMAWIYKNHYGRNIMCEIDNPDAMNREYVFDAETHQYRHPNDADKFKRAEQDRQALKDAVEECEAKKRGQAMVAHKARVSAARLIQRAYRVRLYRPPDGVMFLRSMSRFQSNL